jgi:hypothetical protein
MFAPVRLDVPIIGSFNIQIKHQMKKAPEGAFAVA